MEEAYWHYAEDAPAETQLGRRQEDDRPHEAQAARQQNWDVVNRVAAQAPSKAIDMLNPPAPAIDPTTARAREALDAKIVSTARDPLIEEMETPKPTWVRIETISLTAARRLARLKAPGVDGWTREIFLSSICRGTAHALEMLVNTLIQGSLKLGPFDPTRLARLCLWNKDATNIAKGVRIVGLTSTITKIGWRCVINQHLHRCPAPLNGAMRPGGIFEIIRQLEDQSLVLTADVIDAYYKVIRRSVDDILRRKASPMHHLFRHIYAGTTPQTAPRMVGRCTSVAMTEGVLPGCGGAAICFTLQHEDQLAAVAKRPDVKCFMDDNTATTTEGMSEVIARIGPERLVKLLAIDSRGTNAQPIKIAGLTFPRVTAAKVLGAFIGEPNNAAKLMTEHVGKRLDLANTVVEHPQLTHQSKWSMMKAIIAGITWTFAATRPAVTHLVAEEVDQKIAQLTHKLGRGNAGQKSAELTTLSTAHGGLGLPRFVKDAAAMYSITTITPERTDEDPAPQFTAYSIKRQLDKPAIDKCVTVPPLWIQAHSDATRPWFAVQHINKRLALSNDAFSLAWSHHTEREITYPVCSRFKEGKETTYDHSQLCPVCAGPYRYPRHQRIVNEILSVCYSYGVTASTNFFALGMTKKRPDVIIYRGRTNRVPLLIDITVVHHADMHIYDSTKKRATAKMAKYKNLRLKEDGSGKTDFKPFVMTTRATISKDTGKLIDDIAKEAIRPGFANELVSRTKLALLEFEVLRRNALELRKSTGALDRDLTDSTTSASSGANTPKQATASSPRRACSRRPTGRCATPAPATP